MITSKRDLKKHIDRINTEVAQRVLPAAVLAGIVTEEKAGEIFAKLAQLTAEAHSRLSISFDKSPKSFDSAKDYKKARREYFKTAYNKALADYEQGVNGLLQDAKPAK